MRLTFDRALVEQLFAHSKNAPKRDKLYDMKGTDKPGLLLVGDQGIYLMSNGNPSLRVKGSRLSLVAHAKQCNPETMKFDDWYSAKNAAFGGDDCAEFLSAEIIELGLQNPGDFAVYATPKQIKVLGLEKPREQGQPKLKGWAQNDDKSKIVTPEERKKGKRAVYHVRCKIGAGNYVLSIFNDLTPKQAEEHAAAVARKAKPRSAYKMLELVKCDPKVKVA